MISLDTERAQRILESKDDIKVLYNGSPVWIQSVNADNAKVMFLNSKQIQDVAVGELVEGD